MTRPRWTRRDGGAAIADALELAAIVVCVGVPMLCVSMALGVGVTLLVIAQLLAGAPL